MSAPLRAAESLHPFPAAPIAPENLESPVARLAELHAEGEETARLANLLGRSIYAAAAFVAMTGTVLALGGIGLVQEIVWTFFMLCAAGAIALGYRRTIAQPFERAALKSFSQDLNAILLFAGFAWGAGAFLAIPASANIGSVVLFAAGAGTAVALLLRERECAYLFLAPAMTLTSFACVLRPMAGGALDAAFVLIACGAVVAIVALAERVGARERTGAELAGIPFA